MSDKPVKSTPAGTPADPNPITRRIDALTKAIDRNDEVKVRLVISGGLHDEGFGLDLAATSRGQMQCHMHCQLSHRVIDQRDLQIEPEVVREVLKRMDPQRLLKEAPRQGGFPPDSLIGRLEITVGGETFIRYFMADPEQARTAGVEQPDDVLHAAEVLYREAERRLGIKSVRP